MLEVRERKAREKAKRIEDERKEEERIHRELKQINAQNGIPLTYAEFVEESKPEKSPPSR